MPDDPESQAARASRRRMLNLLLAGGAAAMLPAATRAADPCATADYGHRFIVLPNPTDGHWVSAIFGESEPAPTDENRRRLRDAAMGISPGR